MAVQSAPLAECLPGFAAANPLQLAHPSAAPRIWLGNALTTPTHLDEWFNIGCVVLGRRRFTLFPPGEIGNLYVGPLDYAPTGAPMSLVQLHAPDFDRFPLIREALANARRAELGPGDALFIPPLWWHNVESLDPLNMHLFGRVAIGYMPPEENPALGLRGIRTSLAWPDLLRTQLRAILAVRGPAHCRVMLPMITDAGEIESVRRMLEELRRELGRAEPVSLGVMIETPASAVLAERIAAAADFLSIGTNDLTQYTLAMINRSR